MSATRIKILGRKSPFLLFTATYSGSYVKTWPCYCFVLQKEFKCWWVGGRAVLEAIRLLSSKQLLMPHLFLELPVKAYVWGAALLMLG